MVLVDSELCELCVLTTRKPKEERFSWNGIPLCQQHYQDAQAAERKMEAYYPTRAAREAALKSARRLFPDESTSD